MKKFFIILSIVTLSLSKSEAQDSSIVLTASRDWEFLYVKSETDSVWLPASADLNIYSSLLKNKIIGDPYYSSNADSLEWVQHREWKFRTHFSVSENVLNKKHLSMIFNGLDIYADVFLNGKKILQADNFFRTWEADAKKNLQTENDLLIVFKPVKETSDTFRNALPYTLPGSEYVFTRKPAFQFGWDFAPDLLPCGIIKQIELVYWDDFRFDDIQLHQEFLNDTVAKLSADIFYENNLQGNVELRITDTVQHKTFFTRIIELNDFGKTTVHFEIKNPKRWWCNGYGEPFLYHLKFDLIYYNADTLFSVVRNYGARTIELVQTPDSIGSSFYFKLNGIQIFIKGANYVPSDILMRENFMTERNHELILDAQRAHMNMLRVWGGGTYADENFLNDCDENGIMVWQDFPFACSMYPADSIFIDMVSDEIKENVLRIRNHPSLAMWCGNNEIQEGWFNWDWQTQFHISKTDSLRMWSDYENLFTKKIPELLNQYDSQTPYWQSSPSIGWGHKESFEQGDSHYWGVWWGLEPFDSYITHTGRFVCEYGFQSFPSMNCLKQFLEPEELYLYSPALRVHQKHPTGFETIQTYLKRGFDSTTNFSDYVYLSQLLQARGMSTAIESHRRAMPYCMGTLYWQLNDCWPAISWSSIDFSGEKKCFYYNLNRLYNTFLLSTVKHENKIECWIVSDSLKDCKAEMKLQLWKFSGELVWEKKIPVEVAAQSSEVYYSLALDSLLKKYDSTEIVIHSELISGEKKLSYSDYFFCAPKNLKLENPKLKFKVERNKDYKMPTSITVSCKKPVIDVYFFSEAKNGNSLGMDLNDNFINIFPDEKVKLNVVVMSASSSNDSDFVNCNVLMKCLNNQK